MCGSKVKIVGRRETTVQIEPMGPPIHEWIDIYEPIGLDALDSPELLEVLADIEHERWSGWMTYQDEKLGRTHASGETYTERWYRQSTTSYAELTNSEKESDRIEARKGLVAIQQFLAARSAGKEGER
jgi:hypothetical protein